MNPPSLVLGLETSCDETAAAVVRLGVDGRAEVVSSVVASQIAAHAPYGGGGAGVRGPRGGGVVGGGQSDRRPRALWRGGAGGGGAGARRAGRAGGAAGAE